MCGRYVSPDDAAIEREFTLVRQEWNFPPSYNVAPTQDVPIVRVDKEGERTGLRVHWDLIPFLAKGVQLKYSTINATVEKLTDAATWRGPWKRRQRCIIPALGFFERQVHADGKSKQPFYITLNDQEIFGFAGLWDSSTGADGVRRRVLYHRDDARQPADDRDSQCQAPHARDPGHGGSRDVAHGLTRSRLRSHQAVPRYPHGGDAGQRQSEHAEEQ
jgi:putative SOS response-associated peptidase YedK